MQYDVRICGIPLADFAARMNTDLSSSSPSSLQGIVTTSLVLLIWLNEKHRSLCFLTAKLVQKRKNTNFLGDYFKNITIFA